MNSSQANPRLEVDSTIGEHRVPHEPSFRYSRKGGVWILPVLAVVLVSLTTVVQAQFDYEAGITITAYTGPGGDVIIPETIDGIPVTGIGDSAFAWQNNVTSIIIPDSVTSIGWWALAGCTGLTSILIPDSVTMIGDGAFIICTGLTSAYFRGNAPSIGIFGIYAFSDANNVTVYYLPGTTGWGTTYGGRPTALWIPITPTLPSLTSDNPLKLVTHSPAPATVRVQRSTDLLNWEDWQTVSRDQGPSELQDTEAGTTPYRFYRGVEE